MSEGTVKGDQPVQLNYVIPADLEGLLDKYCEQTLVAPSALVRRLVTDFVDNTREPLVPPREHPRGRRTTVVLPDRLLVAFEAKAGSGAYGTKAAVIAALLADYLPPRVYIGETLKVEVDLPTPIVDHLNDTYGPGPVDALILKALEALATAKNTEEVM